MMLNRQETYEEGTHQEQSEAAASQPTAISGVSLARVLGNQTMQRLAVPRLTTPREMVQRQAANGAETAVPPTPQPSLIVPDTATDLEPGQMRRSDFLAQLKTAVCQTTDEVLAGTIYSAIGCPYIERWFAYYGGKDSQHIERAVRRFAPGAAQATTAQAVIAAMSVRVRQGVATWIETGRVTGIPEGLTSELPVDKPTDLPPEPEPSTPDTPTDSSVQFKLEAGIDATPTDPTTVRASLGNGRSLDSTTRSRIEPAFASDFSQVRIHTDSQAGQMSQKLGARAFTIGRDIAFAPGEYQPGTPVGDALLAHELAHVLQQDEGTTGTTPMPKGDESYNSLENDADVSAIHALASMWGGVKQTLIAGGRRAIPRLKSGLRLQRCGSASESGGTSGEVRHSRMAEHLAQWHADGLLDPPYRPADVAPIPPMTISEEQARELGIAPVAAGAAPLLAPPGPTAPVTPTPTRPPLRLVPPEPVPGPGPGPGVRPIGPPIAVPIIIGIIILFTPSETAPPWMDEINPITGEPYSSPEEYDWVRRLDNAQRDYLRRLSEGTRPAPVPTPTPVPEPEPDEDDDEESCATAYPGYPDCEWLEDTFAHYEYDSENEAFEALKRIEGSKNLRKEKRATADRGPCAGVGWHINVREGGRYVASLVGCPCCSDDEFGPILSERWGILWH